MNLCVDSPGSRLQMGPHTWLSILCRRERWMGAAKNFEWMIFCTTTTRTKGIATGWGQSYRASVSERELSGLDW
jgi:hypothetical protein